MLIRGLTWKLHHHDEGTPPIAMWSDSQRQWEGPGEPYNSCVLILFSNSTVFCVVERPSILVARQVSYFTIAALFPSLCHNEP